MTISNKKNNVIMTHGENTIINHWLELRKITLKEIKEKDIVLVDNMGYIKLTHLTRVNLSNVSTQYYFFDSKYNCAMIYIDGDKVLQELSLPLIISNYGDPEEIVRSRAGKTANHYLYPKMGFAFSEENGEILFFEVFPSITLKDYKDKIYENLSGFIK